MDTSLDLSALKCIFDHVVLPLKLPTDGSDDSYFATHLAKLLLDSLRTFKALVPEEDRPAINNAFLSMDHFKNCHDDKGYVKRSEFSSLIKHLLDCQGEHSILPLHFGRRLTYVLALGDGMIPLYIHAQNAGVLIRKDANDVSFEMFELLPHDKAVINAICRLRRHFPDAALSLPKDTVRPTKFRKFLTSFIEEASRNPVPHMQSFHGQPGEEKQQDTTDPAIITELFFTLLRSAGGHTIQSNGIWKNTREEVVRSEGSKVPWRRSPIWLFLRAALQLSLTKGSSPKTGCSLYKRFMVYFMSCVLAKAIEYEAPPAILFAMRKKIELRLSKLGSVWKRDPQAPEAWLLAVHERVHQATEMLQTIRAQDKGLLLSPELQLSDIEHHSHFQLPLLDQFLRDLNRHATPTVKDFQPQGRILHFQADTLPDMKMIEKDGQCTVFDLAAFEEWVAFHLDKWLASNLTEDTTCHKLQKLMVRYHRIANRFYAGSPEALSSMLLTISEIWVACDKSAVAIDPLLSQYDHEVPVEAWAVLILPFRRQMERLHRVESYLSQRTGQRTLKESVLSSFGHADSYSVRYFKKSDHHQELKANIESAATQKREEKQRELSKLQKEYTRKQNQANKKRCENSSQMENGQKITKHKDDCQKCQLMREAQELTIQVFEWPLPTDAGKAISTVFELSVPEAFAAWRDATLFLCRDVLKLEPCRPETATPRTTLLKSKLPGLEGFQSSSQVTRRINVIAESSPTSKHIGKGDIRNIRKQEVVINSRLNWRFVDEQTKEFLGKLKPSSGVREDCTYSLNAPSESLKQFLEINEQGKGPNVVIARQSECPEHMSLSEFKALCSLPFAHNTHWLNLLREFAMPSVD